MIHVLLKRRSFRLKQAAANLFERDDKVNHHAQSQIRNSVDELELTCSRYEKYATLLRQCGAAKALAQGKRVHALLARENFSTDLFLGNLLVQMYGKCRSLDDAVAVFGRILQKNLYSWTIMFAAFAQNGYVHHAKNLFDRMPERDLVSWTAMVAAYANNGCGYEALEVFKAMDLEGVQADHVAVLCILEACALLAQGRVIHQAVLGTGLEQDVMVGTAVITMYGRCHCLTSARTAFDTMVVKNLVTWNAMIAAYAHSGSAEHALKIFRLMDLEGVKPGPVTFTSILEICAGSSALPDGRYIHFKASVSGCSAVSKVASALVNMYGKCGSVEEAKQVFDGIFDKSVVTWSGMVAAYAQNGYGKEALVLGILMDIEGIPPNQVTLVSILDACGSIPALRQGKLIHESIITDLDPPLAPELENALVHMYGLCGALQDARNIFDCIYGRDNISWNTMISAYANNCRAVEALNLFQEMKLDGTSPSDRTFTSVLSVSGHSGLLQSARQCFLSITDDFSMVPRLAHFCCMVDLLVRAGNLCEAEELIDSMPFEATGSEIATLLGGCKTQGSLTGGTRRIAKQVMAARNGNRSSPYVLLSSIWRHGVGGHEDEVEEPD